MCCELIIPFINDSLHPYTLLPPRLSVSLTKIQAARALQDEPPVPGPCRDHGVSPGSRHCLLTKDNKKCRREGIRVQTTFVLKVSGELRKKFTLRGLDYG